MISMQKKVFLSVFLFSIFTYASAGLLPGTEVFIENCHYKKIEDLQVGDQISIYNIPERGIEEQKCRIAEIDISNIRDVILVQIDSEEIVFDPNQKICNSRIRKFVPAKELKIDDTLFFPDTGNLLIKNVSHRRLNSKIKSYDISIENGNLFLIQMHNGKHLIVRNKPMTVGLFGYTTATIIGIFIPVALFVGIFALCYKLFGKKEYKDSKPIILESNDALFDIVAQNDPEIEVIEKK